jgi:hypothetical protein
VVVCGQKQQQGIWRHVECGSGHGGGRVASNRLQQDGAVYLSGVGTLLNQKTVVFGRYDELAAVQQGGALQSQLQKAFAVDQRNKLLGQGFA